MNLNDPNRQKAIDLLAHYLKQASQGRTLEGTDFYVEVEELVDAIAKYANHINDRRLL